jgi:hypothetical protein
VDRRLLDVLGNAGIVWKHLFCRSRRTDLGIELGVKKIWGVHYMLIKVPRIHFNLHISFLALMTRMVCTH